MGRVLDISVLITLLVATVFGVLALNVSWAKADIDDDEFGLRYGAMTVRQSFDEGDEIRAAYTADSLDESDGIGLVRSGGLLFLLGTILAGVALVAAEHRLLLPRTWTSVATVASSGLAAVLVTVGAILLPIGISELAKDPGLGLAVGTTWIFGFYGGIVAAVLMLAGAVLATVSWLRSTGFRLEAADASPATFD